MATNLSISTIPADTTETVPASESVTATITAASGSEVFTLSAATDNLRKFDWIVDKTNEEVYQISEINGTVGKIVGTFADALSAATVSKIRDKDTRVKSVNLTISGANCSINQGAVAAGTKSFNSDNVGRFLEPIMVKNGATTTVQVDLTKF